MKPTPPSRFLRVRLVRQQGIALFFALIALVALSLAAVALIRAVDTSTLIAGNLSFKQSAISSADSGLERAMTWLAANQSGLDADNAASGYYATAVLSTSASATWATAASAVATGVGIDANGYEATSGNTTRYIIQRMCRTTGTPSTANCLLAPAAGSTSGKGAKDLTEAGANLTTGTSPIYRVTARTTGPKNTVSYIQVFVY